MKNLMVLVFYAFALNAGAQNYPEYDTIRKNEFSVSVSPALLLLGGSSGFSSAINFNFGYKRYFKNRFVLRTAFVIFPNPNNAYQRGNPEYFKTVDTVNVFRNYVTGGGMKSQLNIGVEKIYKVNRLMHGFGTDVFFNHRFVYVDEQYTWQSFSYTSAKLTGLNDTVNHAVDSLGFSQRGVQIGGGFQLFYSLRYKISKRLGLSATIGPSLNFSVFSGNYFDRRTKKESRAESFNVDFPNVPLISDVSLYYRF